MTEPTDLSLSAWLDLEDANALLDIGCNVGHLLQEVQRLKPGLRLAGIEVNQAALEVARRNLQQAELHATGAESLPFSDREFDRATCIEVLEHIPPALQRPALEEIHRVLKPAGSLMLQVPHAGAFGWLDPGNLRFRIPALYSALLKAGLRDQGMKARDEGVLWHHHFSMTELKALIRGLFTIERVHQGGLFLMPLSDIARWPYYRLKIYDGRLFRFLGKTSEWDLARDYGDKAYDVRLLLRRVD